MTASAPKPSLSRCGARGLSSVASSMSSRYCTRNVAGTLSRFTASQSCKMLCCILKLRVRHSTFVTACWKSGGPAPSTATLGRAAADAVVGGSAAAAALDGAAAVAIELGSQIVSCLSTRPQLHLVLSARHARLGSSAPLGCCWRTFVLKRKGS